MAATEVLFDKRAAFLKKKKKKMLILFLPVYERRETRGFLIFHTELNYLTEWQVFSSESCRAKMLTGP